MIGAQYGERAIVIDCHSDVLIPIADGYVRMDKQVQIPPAVDVNNPRAGPVQTPHDGKHVRLGVRPEDRKRLHLALKGDPLCGGAQRGKEKQEEGLQDRLASRRGHPASTGTGTSEVFHIREILREQA